MLVKATMMSSKLRVGIKELGRIANPGEEFEISSVRYPILAGNNKYNAVFVTKVNIKESTAKSSKEKKQKKQDAELENS